MAEHNARLGLRLFGLYAAFYAAFVLLNAFTPSVMDVRPLLGMNLAVLGGFGLILLALVLALIYGVAASSDDGASGEDRDR